LKDGAMQKGNIFEHVLDQVNLVDLISGYIPVERAGRNYKALCPFHSEKTASFIISEEKQLYHCFGCGAAGNAINFVMQYENLDYLDAVELIADRYNIDISEFSSSNSQKKTVDYKLFYAVLRDAANYYYKNLRTAPQAMAYLEKRGLNYDIIRTFGIGFSNDKWTDLINRLGKKYSVATLEQVGLAIENKEKNSHYDRFRNRIMFPIVNPRGKVIGFGGRVMDDSLPKYLNSPETDVFNKSQTLYGLHLAKDHLHEKKQLIICEGYMDVIALHAAGFQNAVATLGTAMTVEHARLMKRYSEEIVVCYDSDLAGQKAALKSIDVLEGVVEKVRVVVLGEGLDPDEYIKKYGPEAFKEKVDDAVTGTAFKIRHLRQGFNLNSEQEKVTFLSKASEIISQVKNGFEKNLYIDELSESLGVNRGLIANEVYKGSKGNHLSFHSQKKSRNIPIVENDRRALLEEQLIVYLTHAYSKLTDMQKTVIGAFEFSESRQDIFSYLMTYFEGNDRFSMQHVIEEADLDVSSALEQILEKHTDEESDIDVDLVLNNILLMKLDDALDALRKELKTTDDVPKIEREIQHKLLLKKELTLKMRHGK
jgi:DNA primase